MSDKISKTIDNIYSLIQLTDILQKISLPKESHSILTIVAELNRKSFISDDIELFLQKNMKS